MQELLDGHIYYTVGELARFYNIPISTLRFYDNHNIFSPQLRDPQNNYRYYSSEQLLQLDVILFLRELDFPTGQIPELIKNASCRGDLMGVIKNHRKIIADEIERLGAVLQKIDQVTETFTHFDTSTGKIETKPFDQRLILCRDASYISVDPSVGRYSFKNRMNNYVLTRGDPTNLVSFGVLSSLDDFLTADSVSYTYQFAQLKHREEPEPGAEFRTLPAGQYLTLRFENQREARLSAYYRLTEHITKNSVLTDGIFIESIVGCGMPPVSEAEDIIELQIRVL